MNPRIRAVLESKRAERLRLAALPFSEKVALLEQLRDRAMVAARTTLYRAHEAPDARTRVLRERSPEK